MTRATTRPDGTPLADGSARLRIERDLDTTLVVEAAAGTGKTTALVGRILALVRSGRTSLARVVSVTFTEKAAGEMKLRLRSSIEEARQEPDITPQERTALEQALGELEAARIGTIHGLCKDLLSERPVEAGIDPMFGVADEGTAEALFGEAFEAWFPRALADPPEGVRRLMRRPPTRTSTPRDALRFAAWQLAGHRDFDGPWRRPDLDREAAIDGLLLRMTEVAALAERAHDPDHHLARSLQRLQRWLDELAPRESTFDRDHDALEAALRDVVRWREWRWKGFAVKQYGPGLTRAHVMDLRDGLKAELERVVAGCDADLAACLHDELQPLVDDYEVLKKRAGALDFLDLLVKTRDLLRDRKTVRAELQRRFSHVLVDEFQDTDPLQVEIVLLLSADDPDQDDPTRVRPLPGKLFVVGDPKQSIYRFRRADIAIYEEVKERLLAAGGALIDLSTSFRSDPRIQRAVNVAFAPRMRGDGQARYVPLTRFRELVAGRPALVALPVPAPFAHYGKVANRPIEGSLPGAVAAWVDWLLNSSGWTVADSSSGAQVPVEGSHVCLLFKRFRKWGSEQATAPYVQELEDRGIAHVLVGGRTLHHREEVLALRNALTAVEWPDDELAVFGTLKGPLFAVPDDALLAWRHEMGRLHPLRPIGEDDDLSAPAREVAEALAVLGRLHFGRNRRPIADTIGQLLEATRAHAGFASWTAGDQVLVNVLRIVEQARRFESGGASSFRAFVELLTAEAERGEATQAPVLEEGTGGVRLMTVHKAKGLEFPVVILCDMTAQPTGARPTRYVDVPGRAWYQPLAGCVPIELLEHAGEVLRRDAEESVRLLYVAATRARDVLVAPVIGDEEREGWVDPLNLVLYPPRAARRSSTKAEGCPGFRDDSVRTRPPKARMGGHTVRPGRHLCEGSVEVIWWDPAALPEERRVVHGLQNHELLMAEGEAAEQSETQHETWKQAREALLERGGRPSLELTSPRDLADAAVKGDGPSAGGEEPPLQHTAVDRSSRPAGRRFGALVHAVLAEVPLDADRPAIAVHVAAQGRRIGATEIELPAAVDAVEATLAHPLLRRAAVAVELRREDPLLLRLDDGTLVEGVLDLAFRDDAGWTVVEFKTSLPAVADRRSASEQLRWYVRAVAEATGEPTRGVLLLV